MNRHLAEWESEAVRLMNKGKLKDAIELFEKVINERPDFEHGMEFYHLAGCYEDLGDLEKAEQNYLKALSYGPGDTIRMGGYAAFLYLHGDPEKSFEMHLKLLSDPTFAEGAITSLKALGTRLGLTEEQVRQKIEAAKSNHKIRTD